jgi:hypothetical protein
MKLRQARWWAISDYGAQEGKWYGSSSKKLNLELSYDPIISFWGIYPKEWETVGCSGIYL